jgi:hypothetical protein
MDTEVQFETVIEDTGWTARDQEQTDRKKNLRDRRQNVEGTL